MSTSNAKNQVEKVWQQIEQNNKVSESPGNRVTESPINRITGTYKDPWFGEITISNKNGQLFFLASRSPGLDGEIFWYKGNTYVVKWKDRSMDADAFILFTLDINAHPAGFTMKAISPLTDFSYDFHDLNFRK